MSSPSVTFDAALETLRGRILRLTCAIVANDYLGAWSAKQDVVRAIERTQHCATEFPEGSARADAIRRLDSVLAVAERMLASAPAPSPAAICQARSTDWRADRGIWRREEQEWLAARNASAWAIAGGRPRTIR
jgi:hypothetical protein